MQLCTFEDNTNEKQIKQPLTLSSTVFNRLENIDYQERQSQSHKLNITIITCSLSHHLKMNLNYLQSAALGLKACM